MFKVLKEFILRNGFKGELGQEVGEDKFVGTEAESLLADGSLEEVGHVGQNVESDVDADKGQEASQADETKA